MRPHYDVSDVGLVCVLLALGMAPAVAADLKIPANGIMVTQAVQDEDNSVPLISGRWTAVRVRVKSPVADSKVTGTLKIKAGGKNIDGGSPINPGSGFIPPPDSEFSWTNENDTLNFEVKEPIPADDTAVFEVKVKTTTPGVGGASDSVQVKVLEPNWPDIRYTRAEYGGKKAFSDDLPVKPAKGDDFLRAIWPVPDGAGFYQQSSNSPRTFTFDSNSNGKIDEGADVNHMLGELDRLRENFISGDSEVAAASFFYAWVQRDAVVRHGWSVGRVGFGNDDPDMFQRTFAHELGHMAGLDHPGGEGRCNIVGWDVGGRLGKARVKDPELYDFMTPGQETKDAWISKKNYLKLIKACASFPPPRGDPIADDAFPTKVLSIQGVLNETGSDLERLRPIFRYPWRTMLIPEPEEGDFLVEVEGIEPGQGKQNKVVQRRFDGLIRDEEGNKTFGFFSVTVPFDGTVKEVRVLKKGQSKPLKVVTASDQSPKLAFNSLKVGDILKASAPVAWNAEDPDSSSDEIHCHLLVSLDSGKQFFPVALDLKSRSFKVPWQELASLAEKGLDKRIVLRLVASDGVNTTVQNLGELSCSLSE
jgi:hypothetical protein